MQSVQCIRDWLARRSRESKRSTRHDARPTEAWRIDAYIMMMAAAAKAGWSEGFERLGGAACLVTKSGKRTCTWSGSERARMQRKFYWLRRP
jgi:hypothetical protein